MDFKFDIRILALSLFIHFGAFGLLSFLTTNSPERFETIEVVIRDDSEKKTFIPTKPSENVAEEKEQDESRFFSERNMRVKKETIAENLGSFKNQKQQAAKTEQNLQKSVIGAGPNFLPKPSEQSSEEQRQSSVNFQVPNLSKGEFTFLNSDFSTYASFYNRITPRIIYSWGTNIDDVALFPHMREKLRQKVRWVTRVELILDRKGYFKDAIIVNSSGAPELDHAVVEALENASPFLNPPDGMIEKDGTVRISGEFSVYTHRPRLAR